MVEWEKKASLLYLKGGGDLLKHKKYNKRRHDDKYSLISMAIKVDLYRG